MISKRVKPRWVLSIAMSCFILFPGSSRAADLIVTAYSGAPVTLFCLLMGAVQDQKSFGFVRKYNLTFQNITLTTSMFPIAASNGDVNISQCSGISTVFNAWRKGARGMFIFSFGSKAPVYQMVVQPGLTKLSDMKGKRIGIPGLQSAGAEAIEMILKRGANLLPQKDYNFTEVGGAASAVAAMLAKRIDATPSYPPYSYAMERQGFKILGDVADYVPQYVTGIQLANRAWVEKNPELFDRLLKAMIETGAWFKDPANQAAVETWIMQHVSAGPSNQIDAELARRLYEFYIKDDRLALDGYAPESAVRSNLDILKERGYITDAEIPPLGQVVDLSYLNRARRELGLSPVPEYAK